MSDHFLLTDDQRAVLVFEETARAVARLLDLEAQLILTQQCVTLRKAVGLPASLCGPAGKVERRGPPALVVLPGGCGRTTADEHASATDMPEGDVLG